MKRSHSSRSFSAKVILALARTVPFVLVLGVLPSAAHAVPSFSQVTGQPCAACHVGAFGPQLTQYGRDFKEYGYVSTDNKPHDLPIAFATTASFTNTDTSQASPLPHEGPNNNIVPDGTSLFYAGRITPTLGAFIEVQYDGAQRNIFLGDVDIRRPLPTVSLFGQDLDSGLHFSNVPTETDIWNSTPVWGFPYVASRVAPTPAAATLIDATLAGKVVGPGIHADWNSLVYLETDAYFGLGHSALNALGEVPVLNADSYPGVIPYWRAALQHDFDNGRTYVEFGTYGIVADSQPQGMTTAGVDHTVDYAFDANYQLFSNPKDVTSDYVSAHATWIRQEQHLGASSALLGTNPTDSLSTFRADVSYSIAATWTPTLQYFRTTGSSDAALWGTANGSPNTKGYIAELTWAPWGKPDSPVGWANARVGLQYVGYTQFDGQTSHASDNNTIFISFKIAFAPFAPFEK